MGVVLVEIRTLLRQTIVPQTALNMAVRAFPGAPLAAQLKLRQDRFTSNVCRETQTLPKLVKSEAGLFEKRGLCISTTTNPILSHFASHNGDGSPTIWGGSAFNSGHRALLRGSLTAKLSRRSGPVVTRLFRYGEPHGAR